MEVSSKNLQVAVLREEIYWYSGQNLHEFIVDLILQ